MWAAWRTLPRSAEPRLARLQELRSSVQHALITMGSWLIREIGAVAEPANSASTWSSFLSSVMGCCPRLHESGGHEDADRHCCPFRSIGGGMTWR